jgi:hypothetical protein
LCSPLELNSIAKRSRPVVMGLPTLRCRLKVQPRSTGRSLQRGGVFHQHQEPILIRIEAQSSDGCLVVRIDSGAAPRSPVRYTKGLSTSPGVPVRYIWVARVARLKNLRPRSQEGVQRAWNCRNPATTPDSSHNRKLGLPLPSSPRLRSATGSYAIESHN